MGKLIQLLTGALSGPLISMVEKLGVAYINKEISETEFRAQLSLGVLDVLSTNLEKNADNIQAEVKSEHFIQYAWRPIVALSFAGAFMFYVLFEPVLYSWLGVPRISVDAGLISSAENIVLVCLTGYMGFRSLEKISDVIMRWWNK